MCPSIKIYRGAGLTQPPALFAHVTRYGVRPGAAPVEQCHEVQRQALSRATWLLVCDCFMITVVLGIVLVGFIHLVEAAHKPMLCLRASCASAACRTISARVTSVALHSRSCGPCLV